MRGGLGGFIFLLLVFIFFLFLAWQKHYIPQRVQ